jgi:hypothetical protein
MGQYQHSLCKSALARTGLNRTAQHNAEIPSESPISDLMLVSYDQTHLLVLVTMGVTRGKHQQQQPFDSQCWSEAQQKALCRQPSRQYISTIKLPNAFTHFWC